MGSEKPDGTEDENSGGKDGFLNTLATGIVNALQSGIERLKREELILVAIALILLVIGSIFFAALIEEPLILAVVPIGFFLVVLATIAIVLGRGPSSSERRTPDEKVRSWLQGVCVSTAATLDLESSLVRSNVFTQSADGALRIRNGWHHNMGDPLAELSITIPVGAGATGQAFEKRASVIARAWGGWGSQALSSTEMAKVHPDLKWIVSTPIPKATGRGEMSGILSVDGLKYDRNVDQLKPVQQQMLFFAKEIGEQMHLAEVR